MQINNPVKLPQRGYLTKQCRTLYQAVHARKLVQDAAKAVHVTPGIECAYECFTK